MMVNRLYRVEYCGMNLSLDVVNVQPLLFIRWCVFDGEIRQQVHAEPECITGNWFHNWSYYSLAIWLSMYAMIVISDV